MAEHLYLGNDNTIDRVLRSDGTALTSSQMAAITKVTISFGSTTIDSDEAGAGPGQPFDWETRADEGVLILDLGGQTITAGSYLAELIVFDATNTNGIVWGNIPIIVE